ncbi:MAG: ferrochelatase [Chloroflexi bacterium]|nr:ferrochelatase [Chloroflexota bacterium]
MSDRLGVLLMTYGSPTDSADVARYLRAMRGGRDADPELLAEFQRRYDVIGGSPLIPLTERQAAALQVVIGGETRVLAAMRFSEPSIATALSTLADEGIDRVAGIILSPQYSPLLMGGYARDVAAARAALGDRAPEVSIAGAWYQEPAFVRALAGRIRATLASFPEAEQTTAPVLLTAHSLPLRVANQEPDYLAQLEQTAVSVAAAAGIDRSRWIFCWQSAGHEPGDWMQPDFADLMPGLAAGGHRSVVVAPVQFLSDHLETLYDVDIGAREQAEEHGLRFVRIAALNDDPGLMDALANVVREVVPAPGLATT